MLAELILSSIQKLKLAGADFIIMPSNTPHYAFDKVKVTSPLPLLNLIEITVDRVPTIDTTRLLAYKALEYSKLG